MSLRVGMTPPRAGRRLLAAALAVLIAVLLGSACGGGAEAPASPTPSGSPPASAPASPSPATPAPLPTLGPARGRIAFVDPDGNLTLADPDGKHKKAITKGGGVAGFQWSPDGSLLAVEGAGFGLKVIRPEGDVVFEVGGASTPVWSPQGDRLAVSRGSDTVVYDGRGHEEREVANAMGAAWSPDGKTLAVLRVKGQKNIPVLVDVAGGAESALSESIEAYADSIVYPIVWRPDGKAIAYRDSIYDPATGEKTDLPGVPVVWAKDGRMLMVTLDFDPASNATPAHLLDMTRGGKPIIGLDIRPSADGTPPWLYIRRWIDWSPNSRYLVYMDPEPFRFRVRIYDTVAIRQIKYPDVKGETPSVSPDNTYVVFMDAGKVWVLALDGSSLNDVAEGSFPVWQPGS